MAALRSYVIDLDSTFTKVEALDVLREYSLAANPDKQRILNEIHTITNRGMEGSLTFRESLQQSLELLYTHIKIT